MEAGEGGGPRLPLAQMGFHQSKKNHYIWSKGGNVTWLKKAGEPLPCQERQNQRPWSGSRHCENGQQSRPLRSRITPSKLGEVKSSYPATIRRKGKETFRRRETISVAFMVDNFVPSIHPTMPLRERRSLSTNEKVFCDNSFTDCQGCFIVYPMRNTFDSC